MVPASRTTAKMSPTQERMTDIRTNPTNSSQGTQVSPVNPCALVWLRFFLRPLQTARPKRSSIQPMQTLGLGASNQRIVRNSQQVFRHEPDGLLGNHALQRIETPHMDGPRKSPQRSLSPQIEAPIRNGR